MNTQNAKYKTKQRELIINFLSSAEKLHVTAAQVFEHFEFENRRIGRTTVFRQLEKLAADGIVRKYYFEGIASACYEYALQPKNANEHYHLKCDGCGNVTNLNCSAMDEVLGHILKEHNFKINDTRTVFYGKCKACCAKN